MYISVSTYTLGNPPSIVVTFEKCSVSTKSMIKFDLKIKLDNEQMAGLLQEISRGM